MVTPATKEVNLESLITIEKLEELKEIRVLKIPKKIDQKGDGTYGKVFLFEFEDGSFRVGKIPSVSIYNKAAEEDRQMKKTNWMLKGFVIAVVIAIIPILLGTGIIRLYTFPQSDEEAVKRYRISAEQGDEYAQFNLGNMYKDGRGVLQSDEEAIKWFTKSAEQGNANAHVSLWWMYDGQGVPQLDEEAVKWYRKTVGKLLSQAQFYLGVSYAKGQGVPQSHKEAVKWFRKAAEQGYADAQYSLGWMYGNGRGAPRSDEEAFKWYTTSAEQGNVNAQINLGWMYENGQGVPRSDKEAVKWYKKAAEQGNVNAHVNLWWIYDRQGVPQAHEKAAKQGNVNAQVNPRWVDDDEQSIHQPHKEAAIWNRKAVKWFRIAAEQGDADAQYKLGRSYLNGQGVTQSDERAVKWFREAAEQGDAGAQFNLGLMYESGQGVPQSREEALKWYTKSAEQGNNNSKIKLDWWESLLVLQLIANSDWRGYFLLLLYAIIFAIIAISHEYNQNFPR